MFKYEHKNCFKTFMSNLSDLYLLKTLTFVFLRYRFRFILLIAKVGN